MGGKRPSLGLPIWVLIGAVAGIATGIFFGDYAKILEPIGQAYIQLLTICVYPYLIASLLHGLGKLAPSTAQRLFKHAWPAYVIGWGLSILTMMLLGRSFPKVGEQAVLDSHSMLTGSDFINLIIPSNLFLDLTRNAVPSVVVFAILYGIAVQRIKNKDSWLEALSVIKLASITIWNWVIFVAPVGVFALLASTSGSIHAQDIAGMFLYVALYFLGSFLLAFWVIPAFLACVIPAGYREILRELRGAFVLAMATSLSVAAIPGIIKTAENLLAKNGVKDEMTADIIGTNVSVAYPLTQLGNIGVILFFYFCAFYFKAPLSLGDQTLLPFLSLFSTMGSPSTTVTAVPFLASIFRTPESTLSLWVVTMTFTRYAQVALTVSGFALATLWPTLAFYGKSRMQMMKIAGTFLLGFAMLGGIILTAKEIHPLLLMRKQNNYMTYIMDAELTKNVDATVYNTLDEVPKRSTALLKMEGLDRIRSGGVLRVGYDPIVIPFCYRNKNGSLVGYDVAFMYCLAKDMNVRLEYVPMTLETMTPMLVSGEIDIAANGIFVTEERMRTLTVSTPYLQTSPVLLARSAISNKLTSRSSIQEQTGLKVACLNSPALMPVAKALFPGKHIVPITSYDTLLTDPSLQAAVWSLFEARAFAMAHPGFTAVVPKDFGSPLLIAYLMGPEAGSLQRYMDHWIQVREEDGFAQKQYHQWIDGIQDQENQPRWSIIRNVLHWLN